MATITIYVALDMTTDTSVWIGRVLSESSSKIVKSDGDKEMIYTGSFLYGDAGLIGGTLKGYSQSADGVIQYRVTGGSVSVEKTAKLINSDQASQLNKIIFAGNDVLNGSGDNDILDGGTGNDKMSGGKGDDTYYLDSMKDKVIEKAAGGTDTVISSIGYTIGNEVEILNLMSGKGNISGTGNGGDNTITGNEGNNDIDGGAGNDKMSGGKGDDTYYVDSVKDTVTEKVGEGLDTIISRVSYILGDGVEVLLLDGAPNLSGTGNKDDNIITGNEGTNILNGKEGNDELDGGSGADKFVFDTKLDQATNVDSIDFSPGDSIYLSKTIFGGSGTAISQQVPSDDFISGAAPVARDLTDHFLYDTINGKLYYDADGSATKSGLVLFAVLIGHPTLVASDLQIY